MYPSNGSEQGRKENKILIRGIKGEMTPASRRLPLSEQGVEHAPSVPRARLLVADDDRLILATLSEGLRDRGYDVLEAVDGDEAVRLCGQHNPDLAILDIRMPKQSGIEVARRLQETVEVPFMFLSAYGDEELVVTAAECGALGYLLKPLDVPQIIPAIEAAMMRAAEIRQLRESERKLHTAIASGRETSAAVGVLMERHKLTGEAAFEALRQRARRERRKIADVARELIEATESLNRLDD
jgi:AmiR/NasT family two-component response regulator